MAIDFINSSHLITDLILLQVSTWCLNEFVLLYESNYNLYLIFQRECQSKIPSILFQKLSLINSIKLALDWNPAISGIPYKCQPSKNFSTKFSI